MPSALQCFSWPDGSVTQTFDPQSPPCVATWPGQAQGNGGSTAQGVSATDVRIGIPRDSTSATAIPDAYLQAFVNFYNTHFELYGRHITLVPFPSQQASEAVSCNECSDPVAQKADAQTAASYHLFAALDFVDPFAQVPALAPYLDTLASEKIISVSGGNSSDLIDANAMAAEAPFEWTYTPAVTSLWTATGSLICNQLARHVASFSPEFKTTPRKFAVLVPAATSSAGSGLPIPGTSDLDSEMASCGLPAPPVVDYYSSPSKDESQLLELRNEGVTSLVYYGSWGQGNSTSSPQAEAAHVGYEPEWVDLGWDAFNAAGVTENGSGEAAQTFGVASFNKETSVPQEFWGQSFVQGGGDPTQLPNVTAGESIYHELLLLASGIQVAGPDLTAQTFADALHQTQFPNPGSGAAPYYQAAVGFPGTSVNMVDDLAGFWFDPQYSNAASVNAAEDNDDWQAFCYVNLGQRWGFTDWPSNDGFYSGGCR